MENIESRYNPNFIFFILCRYVIGRFQSVLDCLRQYIMRMRFDACNDAYNFETRAEVRVRFPIYSRYWPSYFYRFLSLKFIVYSISHSAHSLMWILVMGTNSVARYFLVKTNILDSLGVVEVPALCMLEEAVQFTFPCVNRIMQKLKCTGGGVVSSLYVLICLTFIIFSLCSNQARPVYSRLRTHADKLHGPCYRTMWQALQAISSDSSPHGVQPGSSSRLGQGRGKRQSQIPVRGVCFRS